MRIVHSLDILGDPVRRRILELLAHDERPAGAIVEAVGREFGISQPAVSQHLRILRDSGFTTVRPQGARRLYAVSPDGLRPLRDWVEQFHHLWETRLDALEVEIARGKKSRPTHQQKKDHA